MLLKCHQCHQDFDGVFPPVPDGVSHLVQYDNSILCLSCRQENRNNPEMNHTPVHIEAIARRQGVRSETGQAFSVPMIGQPYVYNAVCSCGFKTGRRQTENEAHDALEAHRVQMAAQEQLKRQNKELRATLEKLKSRVAKPKKRLIRMEED